MRKSDRSELTVTIVTVPCESLPAGALVCAGPSGDTDGLRVAYPLPRLTDVHRMTGGVSGVQLVANLAAAGVAALQVDTESVLQ